MNQQPIDPEAAEIQQRLEVAAVDNEAELRREMNKIESALDTGAVQAPRIICLDVLVAELKERLAGRDPIDRERRAALEAQLASIDETTRLSAEDFNIRINARG